MMTLDSKPDIAKHVPQSSMTEGDGQTSLYVEHPSLHCHEDH
jgi:hypothetical protein